MSIAVRFAAPLLVALPLAALPLAARAQSPADTATALQTSLRAWVTDLTGPAVDLGAHQVSVTPDGDAYRFELPVAGPVADSGWVVTGDPVTVLARPLDANRWSIESLTLPSPLRAAPAPVEGQPKRGWALDIANQHISGVFDPSLATPSSLDAVIDGYNTATEQGEMTQTTSLDHYAWHAGWQPVGDGRVTVATDGHVDGMKFAMDLPKDKGRVTATAATISSSTKIDLIAFDRLGVALRATGALLPTFKASEPKLKPGDQNKLTPEQQTQFTDLVAAVRESFGGFQQDGRLEKLAVDYNGSGATVEAVTVSNRVNAPGGMLDASFRIALDGIETPLVPPGVLHDYLPRHIVLAPHFSGVPASDFIDLLQRAIDANDFDIVKAQAPALLAKGPFRFGFDELSFDLGTAKLVATGVMTMTSPTDITGTARITATGLDALIRRANTAPELARAAPFLIMAKGFGDQQGDTTVWNIAYADGHATVNGTDLRALMPHPPASRPPARRQLTPPH